VEPGTGKPVAGSSVQNSRPNCDKIVKAVKVNTEIKGELVVNLLIPVCCKPKVSVLRLSTSKEALVLR